MIGLCPLTWFSDKTDSWWEPPAGVRSIIDLRPIADCALRGTYGDFPHVLMVADEAPKADGWETLSDGDPRDLRVDQNLLDTGASKRRESPFSQIVEADVHVLRRNGRKLEASERNSLVDCVGEHLADVFARAGVSHGVHV